MTDPWNPPGQPVSLDQGGGTVTLVDESTFTISGRTGDIGRSGPHGLFVRDLRLLSRFELLINGRRPEPLTAVAEAPFSATFVSRCSPRPGIHDSTMMVFRSRYVGQGMREEVVLRNFGDEPAFCQVELSTDADFADLFAVKEGRVGGIEAEVTVSQGEGVIRYSCVGGASSRGCELRFVPTPNSVAGERVARYEIIVPARDEWKLCVEVHPVLDGRAVDPVALCGEPVGRSVSSARLARWRRQVPQVVSDRPGLGQILARSAEDLGSLRIFDPDYPERMVVAAGAPWFMTVFGRDSLITAWMALLVDPDLALGVLQTLGRFQGQDVDPRSEEEPGRILHEMRFGEAPSLSLGGGSIYYGTVDATPLFVMLLGELRRWGLAREVVDELMPNAERALSWVEHFGDSDGDGYVEYKRATDRGLVNQGWKDSWDGIRFADGEVAKAPIALCEVQAYVYGAYLARAHFAFEAGDDATYSRYREKASDLKVAFNRDFWLEDKGWFAVGLDAEKRPIDSLTSNIGHCLWTGIVDDDKAERVVQSLISNGMLSGWGVRTLSSEMSGYNPISYHCGSVWPHDTAIVASGLARYGYTTEALQVVTQLFDVAECMGGRLPELYSGLSREEFPTPVGYPTSCSPQAWAAASPLLCLRTILGLNPWVPYGKTWVAPVLPEGMHHLKVEGIPLAGSRVTIEVDDDGFSVDGLPPEIELIREPRKPASAI